MSFTIDTAQEQPINLAPQTLYEEVIQNVWFLLSSLEYIPKATGECAP